MSISAARVYDNPDYHHRGAVRFERGLQELGGRAADYDAAKRKFYRQMNAYARERGIYAMRGQDSTQLGFAHDKCRPEFKNWDCVHDQRERFYCWSRDELARKRVSDLIGLIKECGFSIFFLHPVDGGGVSGPEMWSQRFDRCRQRFGDDRWKASAHQFNLWAAQVIRRKDGQGARSAAAQPLAGAADQKCPKFIETTLINALCERALSIFSAGGQIDSGGGDFSRWP